MGQPPSSCAAGVQGYVPRRFRREPAKGSRSGVPAKNSLICSNVRREWIFMSIIISV